MVKIFSAVVCFFLLCSCANKKEIVYFQNINSLSTDSISYEPSIKPDDQLIIFVSSTTPEAVKDFNLLSFGTMDKGSDVAMTQLRFQTYLVDINGEIDFPVLGKVKLAGLKKTAAIDKLRNELAGYIKAENLVVTMRINNFKVSVMGEVVRPGSFPVPTERITLPEVLSHAGDLTVYGDRKNVLVVREIDGVKTYNYVDMTSVDFFKSPFYYMSQNDLVYVSPNQTRVNSSAVGPNTSVIISSVSLLITLVALIVR
jgi:polysaccharide export outer membrane protein